MDLRFASGNSYLHISHLIVKRFSHLLQAYRLQQKSFIQINSNWKLFHVFFFSFVTASLTIYPLSVCLAGKEEQVRKTTTCNDTEPIISVHFDYVHNNICMRIGVFLPVVPNKIILIWNVDARPVVNDCIDLFIDFQNHNSPFWTKTDINSNAGDGQWPMMRMRTQVACSTYKSIEQTVIPFRLWD